MKCCNAYESEYMRNVMGETLRPGGFQLTDKAMEFCKFSQEDTLLDLGSGMGSTVNYVSEKYGIKAVGVDPSKKLIKMGKDKYKSIDLVYGTGEKIPFKDNKFKGVFAECTLSLMNDLNCVLKEVSRVLKKDGWFVINDVYAKKSEFLKELNGFPINSCMRGLHDLKSLKKSLMDNGFKILHIEDCSDMLKSLMVKIIFSHGSMSVFWNKTTRCSIDGCEFENVLRKCKPGYFILMAKRGEKFNG
ncbi:DVU_1556 family methyltransferase [Clostridium sp. Mt-5]|uniref:DVU_1556 family methyltransferase n=1 Tax=Clostridium moutaii TaxID=3240932 RepID=A0ABV4BQM0_9CLOT